MTPSRRGLAANPALPAPLLDHLVATADDERGPILAAREDFTREHARALATRCGPGVLYPLLERGLLTPADIPFGAPGASWPYWNTRARTRPGSTGSRATPTR